MIQERSWLCREHKASISQEMICGPPALESPGMLIKAANPDTHTQIHIPQTRTSQGLSESKS